MWVCNNCYNENQQDLHKCPKCGKDKPEACDLRMNREHFDVQHPGRKLEIHLEKKLKLCTDSETVTCLYTRTEPSHQLIPTLSSINVKWKNPFPDLDIISYQVMYRSSTDTFFKTIDSGTEEVEISDLTQGTDYEVIVLWVGVDGCKHRIFREIAGTLKRKQVCNVQSENTFHTKYDINTSSTSMTVKWGAFKTKEVVCSYQVKYRLTTETRFTCIDLEEGEEVEITGLKPNTKYEVKVFWIGDDGNNNIMFEDFKTTAKAKIRQNKDDISYGNFNPGENDQYPSEWREIVPSSTTLMVSWKDSSKENSDIIGYLAKYRISTEKSQFAEVQSEGTAREIEICGLKPNTTYDVKVFWMDGQGENHRMFADLAMTTKSKSLSLIDKDTLQMGGDEGKPIVYQLQPINIERIGENMQLRICDMIQGYDRQWDSNKEKTILLLGATGTGKSTFIEALINYVAEVSYSEDHRFSIVNKTEEEELREKDQTGSQTSSITIYRIPEIGGLKVKHKINIVDTPGFNDTRDDFDKQITTQMKHLFEKTLEHVDAIFLVLQLSTNRLTEGQRHVFKSILELFGKDVEKNVFLIITHDDGGSPEGCLGVLRAVGIPYKADKQFFRFNNSNLFTNDKRGSGFWEERTKTFSKMFQVLENVPRTALEKSKKVMRTRDKLENKLEGLRDDIRRTVDRAAEVIKTKKAIKAGGTDDTIDDSSVWVEIARYHQQYTRKNSMNCHACKKTCHKDCWVIFDILLSTCEIFEDGFCTVCKCKRGIHERGTFIYVKKTEKIKVPKDESKLRIEFEESLKTLQIHMKEMEDHIVKLTQIALSPPKNNAMEVQMSDLIREMDISDKGKELFMQCLSLFMEKIPFTDKISMLLQEE